MAFTPVSLSQHYLATSSTTSTAGPTDSSTTALECGIFGIFGSAKDEPELRSHLISCSSELRHRGPDWSGYMTFPASDGTHKHGIAHERLAIMDPESGAQPLTSEDGNVIVAVNGEIYNFKELYTDLAKLGVDYTPKTGSDCEVLLPLFEKYGPTPDMVNKLRGMFSFILYDRIKDQYVIARDHMGITPLYIGWGDDGAVYVGSEMKSMYEHCNRLQQFPPGHIYSNMGENAGEFVPWFVPKWKTQKALPTNDYQPDVLRYGFEKAVISRMMSDVPWGVLLSGGLDSSLVASIASRHMARSSQDFPKLHSFSVGLEGSPDLLAAKKVADYLGTKHHSYQYTLEEGADAVRATIQTLETYDVTTIRASTPMYLMARKIKAMGIKMVLSGEGADEMFGGYLYFHKCPNKQEFQDECKDKLDRLHMYDCLRCNKSMSAWGVEPRVPFLDADFLDLAMNINPEEKMIRTGKDVPVEDRKIEKYLMRKAFDTPEDPYLPDEILWRQKEQFSDGVGYGWVDSLKDIAAREISDQMLINAANRFPYNTPTTKEGYRYRKIFEEFYPGQACAETVPGGKSIACSTERAMAWDESFATRADPSGRAAGVHDVSYDATYEADDKVEKKQAAVA